MTLTRNNEREANTKAKAKAEWTGNYFEKSMDNCPKTASPIKLL